MQWVLLNSFERLVRQFNACYSCTNITHLFIQVEVSRTTLGGEGADGIALLLRARTLSHTHSVTLSIRSRVLSRACALALLRDLSLALLLSPTWKNALILTHT